MNICTTGIFRFASQTAEQQKLMWTLNAFNVGLELRKWVIADCLTFMPKDDPNTRYHNMILFFRDRFPALEIIKEIHQIQHLTEPQT